MSKANYAWKPISIWQGEWQSTGLADVIKEFRQYMTAEAWDAFHQKSAREWSIETGQIEGAYDIEAGHTIQLIEHGLVASYINEQRNGLSTEQVHQILLDSKAALEGVFDFVKSERALSVSYIRELHQQIMSTVDTYDGYFINPETLKPVLTKLQLEKGKFKTDPNNPRRDDGSIHEYCPPHEVAAQMEEMIRLFHSPGVAGMPEEVQAAWLHHAFTQIHPFQDGNGRVARVLASLVLIKGGLPPFTVVRQMRGRYIQALESADRGNSFPLVQFFESCLYRITVKLWRELSVPSPKGVTPDSNLDELIRVAQEKIIHARGMLPLAWKDSASTMTQFMNLANTELNNVGSRLQAAMQAVDSSITTVVGNRKSESPKVCLAIAQGWGDEAIRQCDSIGETRTLRIHGANPAEIQICFDPLSSSRHGLWGAFAQVTRGEQITPLNPAFFSNFKQQGSTLHFQGWLTRVVNQAIYNWQAQLP